MMKQTKTDTGYNASFDINSYITLIYMKKKKDIYVINNIKKLVILMSNIKKIVITLFYQHIIK